MRYLIEGFVLSHTWALSSIKVHTILDVVVDMVVQVELNLMSISFYNIPSTNHKSAFASSASASMASSISSIQQDDTGYASIP